MGGFLPEGDQLKDEVSNLRHLRDAARLVVVVLSSSHFQGVEELQGPPHAKNDVE